MENHPFKTNQVVRLTNPVDRKLIRYSIEPDSPLLQFSNGNVYIVNKSKNVVGLKTLIDSNEVYFRDFSGSGTTSDDDTYLFESTFTPITATAKRIKTTVAVSTSHNLQKDDTIEINIVPNISVGIGTTSSSVSVVVDELTKNILINPITLVLQILILVKIK